jgi:hypothetical protein
MGVWLAGITFLSCLLLLVSVFYTIPSVEAICTFTYGIDDPHGMVEGDNLYVFWKYNTARSIDDGEYYLQFTRSTDGGQTFGDVITLWQTDPDCYMHTRMSADDDNIYVMWQDDNSIMFRGSNDAGETFGNTTSLGKGLLGSSNSYLDGGRILASGDRMYAVWSDGSGNINFRKSDDSGKSLSTVTSLNTEFESYEPRISSFRNNVYVIWTENYYCLPICETELLFVYSDDYGETFSEPRSFEELTGNDISMPAYPIIKSNGNNVYMLWKEDFWNFYFSASHDSGQTFSEKIQVTDFAEGEGAFGYTTLFSVLEDTIYIGWQSQEGRNAILKSTDGGQSFAIADLTIPESFAPQPGMVLMEKKGEAYFLWPSHLSKNSTIVSFASVLEGTGEEVEPVNAIEYSESKPYGGMMTASGDIIHILWTNSTGPESNYRQQLYVRTSTDAGRSFGDSVQIANITTVPEFPYHILLVVSAVIGSIIAISRTGLLPRFFGSVR